MLSNPQIYLNVLAGGMLVLSFFIVARMRLRSMLTMFAFQSLCLALFAAVSADALHEQNLLLTAALVFILKVWFIPRLLRQTAERGGATHRLHTYLRPATMLFLGALIVMGAFFLAKSLVKVDDPNYLIVSASVAVVLLGLFMLVSRKEMYGQIIGFLLMESGVFTFGLALTGGMPLLVEIGIFFDVTIGSVLMAGLSYRVQKEHETVITDRLSELVD